MGRLGETIYYKKKVIKKSEQNLYKPTYINKQILILNKMKLILVRHAQTHLNTQKRYQGKRSDDELNEYGIKQANKTREYLKNRTFDAIFSSPQRKFARL